MLLILPSNVTTSSKFENQSSELDRPLQKYLGIVSSRAIHEKVHIVHTVGITKEKEQNIMSTEAQYH